MYCLFSISYRAFIMYIRIKIYCTTITRTCIYTSRTSYIQVEHIQVLYLL